MRVLLISNIYPSASRPFGGTFVSRRIEALQLRGHEVWPVGVGTVSTGGAAVAGRLRGRPPRSSAPVPPYDDILLPVDLRGRVQRRLRTTHLPKTHELARLVEQNGIDLVHGHGMYLFPAGGIARDVAQLSGVPYVVTTHGQDLRTHLRGRRGFYREVLQGAGAVICVSTDLAATVRDLTGHGTPVHVVPNGYDPDIFFSGREEPTTRGSTVLFVGNLERVKGADRLPRLWRALRAARPDLALDVVGAGSLAPHLRKQLAGARWRGQVSPPQVAARMRAADVLVLPSRSEGWPTVITEAYACGLPVVGFDVGGVGEAIGLPGRVVPTRAGVPGLARSVLAVLDQPGVREGVPLLATGRTWADVARREERVYREVTGKQRTRPDDTAAS